MRHSIFTLCAVAVTSTAVAQSSLNPFSDGKVNTFNNNYVVYMTQAAPTKVIESPVGTTQSQTKTAFDELGILFTCNNSSNTNINCLTSDYTDPETGATFPAGYYYTAKVGNDRSYFAIDGVSGFKNVKKMIFYWAASSTSGVQFSSYLVKEGGITVSSDQHPDTPYSPADGIRCSMDNNIKFKNMMVPSLTDSMRTETDTVSIFTTLYNYYNTKLDDNGKPAPSDWTAMIATRPLKFTLDFTQPSTQFDVNVDLAGDFSGDITVPYGHSTLAKQDANGKDVAGESIAWAADNIIQQGYKKAAYLLGVAFITGEEGASTYYANISNSTDDDEATWQTTDPQAAHSDFADDDEPSKNLYFSWLTTEDFRNYVKAYVTGIETLTTPLTTTETYNLMGLKATTGFVVRNGKVDYLK